MLELRKHGFQLSAAEVFRHPTIASCATHLQERGHEGEPPLDLRPAEVDAATRQRLSRPGDVELYPATPMQALMVETSLLYRPQDRVYRDLTLWEIQDDPLDLGALRAALERQLLHQTSLRVSFRQDRDGRWYQRISPVEAVEIASHDVSALAPPAQDERVRELTREALGRPFHFGEAGDLSPRAGSCWCAAARAPARPSWWRTTPSRTDGGPWRSNPRGSRTTRPRSAARRYRRSGPCARASSSSPSRPRGWPTRTRTHTGRSTSSGCRRHLIPAPSRASPTRRGSAT